MRLCGGGVEDEAAAARHVGERSQKVDRSPLSFLVLELTVEGWKLVQKEFFGLLHIIILP